MTQANLALASLRESSLDGTRFISANLSGVDFRKTNFHHAYYEQVLTDGAVFYGKSPWDSQVSSITQLGKKLVIFDGE